MPKIRIGIIGAGPAVEWEILPVLTGPDWAQPSDEGAWWNLRPTSGGDIRWQAPAQPEVVAICDVEIEKANRLARGYRLPGAYDDWRKMLSENALDAIICERAATHDFEELISVAAKHGARALWFDEPPVGDYELVLHGFAQADARGVLPWWARPLRHAAAHRAARKLIKRGEIGDVTSLHLRWSTPLGGKSEMFSAGNFAAIDLILATAQSSPTEVLAREAKGATTLWISLAGGATATAIFSAADAWNSPLPRLEIIGTQGRSLVCEAGRRMGMFAPRDATRWIEPPGLASHVSAANIGGGAEDLRMFLAAAGDENSTRRNASHAPETDGREAGRALQVLEAVSQSLMNGGLVAIEPLRVPNAHQRLFAALDAQEKNGKAKLEYSPPLTLPLNL